jgi:hypothetical protein
LLLRQALARVARRGTLVAGARAGLRKLDKTASYEVERDDLDAASDAVDVKGLLRRRVPEALRRGCESCSTTMTLP